jgi:hypothetical protein
MGKRRGRSSRDREIAGWWRRDGETECAAARCARVHADPSPDSLRSSTSPPGGEVGWKAPARTGVRAGVETHTSCARRVGPVGRSRLCPAWRVDGGRFIAAQARGRDASVPSGSTDGRRRHRWRHFHACREGRALRLHRLQRGVCRAVRHPTMSRRDATPAAACDPAGLSICQRGASKPRARARRVVVRAGSRRNRAWNRGKKTVSNLRIVR